MKYNKSIEKKDMQKKEKTRPNYSGLLSMIFSDEKEVTSDH